MEILQVLSEWSVAAWLRQSAIAYPFINAAHIFSLALVVGAIVTLDLRLLGMFQSSTVQALHAPLSRVAAVGVVLAIATGFLLFSVRPAAYAQNPAFLIKLGLVGVGVLNALALHFNRRWRLAIETGRVHASLRISAALSLFIWAGAIIAGRWIGFLQ